MESENEKSLQDAASQDANDPLGQFRDRFHIPTGQDGEPLIYFSGNSLGLMPRSAFDDVTAELHITIDGKDLHAAVEHHHDHGDGEKHGDHDEKHDDEHKDKDGDHAGEKDNDKSHKDDKDSASK